MGGAWEWIPTFLTPCHETPPRTAVSGTHILASVSSSLPGASGYGSLFLQSTRQIIQHSALTINQNIRHTCLPLKYQILYNDMHSSFLNNETFYNFVILLLLEFQPITPLKFYNTEVV